MNKEQLTDIIIKSTDILPEKEDFVDLEKSEKLKNLKIKLVEERGRFCEKCKVFVEFKKLNIHHLDYDEGYFDEENCILICTVCHKEIHQDIEFYDK